MQTQHHPLFVSALIVEATKAASLDFLAVGLVPWQSYLDGRLTIGEMLDDIACSIVSGD